MLLNLQKPIVFFDLETTGVTVGKDHIVEICLYKVNPDQSTQTLVHRIRPVDSEGKTVHIPEITTAIHGISDADVADKPTFSQLADEIETFIGNADLAGYNSNKFDVPMLAEEFYRIGRSFDLESRRLIDVQNIFHKMEPRTLKAAYLFYCGKNLDHAHSANADTMATYEVLKAQLDRYQGVDYTAPNGTVYQPIVNDIEQLSRFTTSNQSADLVGHIGYDKQGHEIFNFGKHKGLTLESVFKKEPAYYDWMMKAEFPLSTKACITKVWERMRKNDLDSLKLHFGC